MFGIVVTLYILWILGCVWYLENKSIRLAGELHKSIADYKDLLETNADHVQCAVRLHSKLYQQEADGAYVRNELREKLAQAEQRIRMLENAVPLWYTPTYLVPSKCGTTGTSGSGA